MPVGKALSLAGAALPAQAYRQHFETAAIVGGLVLVAALFGIATRSAGLLAAVWPVNAILLGVMVRWPRLATPVGWAAAVAGYLIADLSTGGGLVNTLILAAGNLAGVAVGYYLLMRTDDASRSLQTPMSVFHLVAIVGAASAAAGMFGAIANPIVLGRPPLTGLVFWFVSEFVNYIAILPVILTMPAGMMRLIERRRVPDLTQIHPMQSAPAVALVFSCVAALYVGGPGALAFPVTALLWCGLTYGVFATAALTLLFSTLTLVSIALGLTSGWPELDAQYELISIRFAVTLMTLAPITVASVMAARNDLLSQLQHMASHDALTGLLSRHAFMDLSEQALAAAASAGEPVAVMMLDIDHFKKINDTYGHSAGDRAIARFASTARACARDADLIVRLGGEEFAVLMVGCTPAEAVEVAERIRSSFAVVSVELDDGRRIEGTVSIGLACTAAAPQTVEPLLQAADEALYLAKGGGRNRIVRRDVPVLRGPPPLPRAAERVWRS